MSYFNKSPIKMPLIRSTIFGREKKNLKPNSVNYLCALRHSRSEKLGRL